MREKYCNNCERVLVNLKLQQEENEYLKHELDKLRPHYANLMDENNKLKKEYDDYINGRPGEWYIVELKKERDRYKEALERIAYDCEHFSAPDEREKLIQKCLDVASAALGQSEE